MTPLKCFVTLNPSKLTYITHSIDLEVAAMKCEVMDRTVGSLALSSVIFVS